MIQYRLFNRIKNIRIILVCLIFISGTFLSKAQFNPIQFSRDSLPNGLQIIYQVDKNAPVVATVIHYKVGSRDENPQRTGFAHFFEHLMFEATDYIPRATIDKYVQEAGGDLNAHTGFDETVFYFHLPSNQIKLALWIESQRMRHLHVDTVGVETQRGVVKEERKMRNENTPYGTWLEKMMAHLFEGSSYGWPPIGTEQHIDRATIEEFRAFYNNFYQPCNAILVISGDINVDDVKKYVNEYFGTIPKSKLPTREHFSLLPMEKDYSETVEDPKATLPAVFIGYRGPKIGDDDSYVMSLINNILSRGESSRFYQKFVNKEQIALQVQMLDFPLQYSGACGFIAIPSPGNDTKDLVKGITGELDNLIKNGITDEEFEKAKNMAETEFVSSKKQVLQKAEDLAQYLAYYNNPNLINTEFQKYQKITKEDVIRVAKEYFDTDKRVILTYLPKQESK